MIVAQVCEPVILSPVAIIGYPEYDAGADVAQGRFRCFTKLFAFDSGRATPAIRYPTGPR
jgi:hypothetical protein